MFASWSRRIWSQKNTRAIMSANLKRTGPRTIGHARAHGFDDAAGSADGGLCRLDPRGATGPGHRAFVAAAVGGAIAAVLPSPVLPYSRLRCPPNRRAGRRRAGAVRGEPRLLRRHHRARLA